MYTVAYQTSLLNISPGDKILEIGTGSGYQTAVLCELGAKVYSIERHRKLHKTAKTCMSKLNYRANLFYGDGYLGLPEESPFDKILLTCGAAELPDVLLNQLKEKGYHVLIFMASQTAGNIDEVLHEIMGYQVDGIVLASVAMSSDLARTKAPHPSSFLLT